MLQKRSNTNSNLNADQNSCQEFDSKYPFILLLVSGDNQLLTHVLEAVKLEKNKPSLVRAEKYVRNAYYFSQISNIALFSSFLVGIGMMGLMPVSIPSVPILVSGIIIFTFGSIITTVLRDNAEKILGSLSTKDDTNSKKIK